MSANAVGIIDPDSGHIAAEIPVGVAPGGVAADENAIWVTNTGGNSVSRIDPATNESARRSLSEAGQPALPPAEERSG